MEHQGKILKREVALSDKSVTEIAGLAGMSRQNVYELYKQEKLTYEQIEAFKIAGIYIDKNFGQMSNKAEIKNRPAGPPEDDVKRLEYELHKLQSEIEFLKWKIKEMQEDAIEQKIEVKKVKDIWVTFQKKNNTVKLQGKRSS